MAFPTLDLLSDSLLEAQRIAKRIKEASQDLHDASAAGSILRRRAVRYISELGTSLSRLNAIRAVPGIGAYAQSQYSDGTLDIAAEFTALTGEIQLTIDWMVANFPQNGGYLMVDQLNANGTINEGTFSSAALAQFRTQLLALIAVIE